MFNTALSTTDQVELGIKIQTSAYGVAIPIVFGTQKIPSNLIGYWDFVATAHTETQGKGGTPSSTTHTYSAVILFGLCEGPITISGFAWQGKSRVTSIADLALVLFHGKYDQIPWGYMTTFHPDAASAMRGQAYACGRYDLGNSSALPNIQFEVGKVAGSIGPVTGSTATFAYMDAVGQLSTLLGTTITGGPATVGGDGSIIFTYSDATRNRVAKLNYTTLAVQQLLDPAIMTPTTPVNLAWMNAQGDLAILSNSASFWILPHGTTTPVRASFNPSTFATAVATNAAGDFFCACTVSATEPKFGVVKYTAATNSSAPFVTWNSTILGGAADLISDSLGNVFVARSGAAGSTWNITKFDPSGTQVWTYTLARTANVLGSIQIASDASIWFTISDPVNISVYRINPTRTAETLILGSAHGFSTSGPLARDWATGDILHADPDGIYRWNEDGTLISLSSTVSLVYLASTVASPTPNALYATGQVVGTTHQYLAKVQDPTEDADEDPSYILTYLLTDPNAGAGFPSARLGSLTQYQNYCLANGIVLSPAITEQDTAANIIQSLVTLTNSRAWSSQGVLQITPYGDQVVTNPLSTITGGAVTFTPNITPVYDLTDDDFISAPGDAPIKVTRTGYPIGGTTGTSMSDAFNQVQLEIKNRANSYNLEPVEAKDQANIEVFGLRPMDVVTAHAVTKKAVGRTLAQLMLQRVLYQRSQYQFTLGWNKILLDPMDLVTITDTRLGYDRKPVRVQQIDEDEDGNLAFTCEDYLDQVSTSALYDSQEGAGFVPDLVVAPGDANTPLIFEPPLSLAPVHADGSFEVWLATSGGPDFGGCEVWASYDNLSYRLVATLTGNSKMGVLSATLNAGSDPDVTNMAYVDMSLSHEPLGSGTVDDADNFRTLCYLDGEYISYETAELLSVDQFRLRDYLRRGGYDSANTSHAAGSPFVRIDSNIARMTRIPSDLGKTIYIKLLAFNDFGLGKQLISDVTATTYTIGGPPIGVALTGQSMTTAIGTVSVTVV